MKILLNLSVKREKEKEYLNLTFSYRFVKSKKNCIILNNTFHAAPISHPLFKIFLLIYYSIFNICFLNKIFYDN